MNFSNIGCFAVELVANIVLEDRGFGITTCETRMDRVTGTTELRDKNPVSTTMDPWEALEQDQEYVDEACCDQGTAITNVTGNRWETISRAVLNETGIGEYGCEKAVGRNDVKAGKSGVGVDLAGLLGKLRWKE